MKLSRRVRANRANARRSTGPRTPAGNSAASRNALRHGLAVPVVADPSLAGEAERLALMIAGEAVSGALLALAHRVAKAQVDLLRVRRARLLLLDDIRARAKPPTTSRWPVEPKANPCTGSISMTGSALSCAPSTPSMRAASRSGGRRASKRSPRISPALIATNAAPYRAGRRLRGTSTSQIKAVHGSQP